MLRVAARRVQVYIRERRGRRAVACRSNRIVKPLTCLPALRALRLLLLEYNDLTGVQRGGFESIHGEHQRAGPQRERCQSTKHT